MTRNCRAVVCSFVIAIGILFLSSLPLRAQDENTTIRHAKAFAISVPLRDLAKLPRTPRKEAEEIDPVRRIPKPHVGRVFDTVEQFSVEPGTPYTLGANIMGVGNGFPGYSVPDAPPDTNMAVGDK